jgi:outer membrane immunogenic protein
MRPSLVAFAAVTATGLPCLSHHAEAGPLAPIWAGAYAGVDIGYAGGSYEFPRSGEELAASVVAGGAHAGYNFQLGSLVAGIEGDAMLSPGTEKNNVLMTGLTVASDASWTASVRGRAGIAIANVLLYGTAGYAFGGGSLEVRYNGSLRGKADVSTESLVVGGGLEARFLPGVSLRLEGLHYVPQSQHVDTSLDGASLSLDGLSAPGYSVVRAGLSFSLN